MNKTNNFKSNKPMAVCQVYKTNDYNLFNTMRGNRNINKAHLKRLRDSIEEESLVVPIIVNENYEIIDGQTRFTAWKSLGEQVYYIIVKGYGLHQVQRLNSNIRNWTNKDYCDSYCQLGYKDYIKFREFKEKYKLGWYECISLLSGKYKGSGKGFERFRTGNFKIKSYKTACEYAEKVIMLKEYYDGWSRRSFVFAMMLLVSDNRFDINRLLQKLKYKRSELVHCTNKMQYIRLLQDIYNYNTSDKVAFIC